MSAFLLARLLESAQAAVLLFRAGLERDAAACLRMAFETFVYLVGCCSDPQFVEEYLASEFLYQRRLTDGGLKLSNLTPDMKRRLEKRRGELEVEVAKYGAKELKVEALAGRFGLGDEYQTIFRLTSPSVHSSPAALRGLSKRQAGTVTGIVHGPSDKYTDVHLFALAEYLLRAADQVATLHDKDIEAQSRVLFNKLRRLCPEWPEEPE